MTTYLELQKQIAALQKEADSLRTAERGGVIERMKEAIAVYEIEANELGFATGRRSSGDPLSRKRASTKARAPKGKGREASAAYSDSNGNTWGGVGKRPNWLREALANGATLEQFAVKK